MKKITFFIFMLLVSAYASAQCINSTAYLTVTSANDGNAQQISTCTYSTEYNTINGLVLGADYDFSAQETGADVYVTITDTSNNVIANGPSPLSVAGITSTSVRLHVTADAACTGGSVCHTTSFQLTTPVADLCFAPTGLSVSNIMDVTADLSWTAGGTNEVDYNVEVYLAGESAAGGNTPVFANANVAGTSVTASGLAPTTDYDVFITAACSGATANSSLVGPVSFTTTASCSDVSGIAVSTITNIEATISWTPGTGNDSALVEVYASGESAAGGNTPVYSNATASGGTDTATGLSGSTDYDVYVTGQCGATSTTAIGAVAFTTACDPFSAPYTEGFENSGNIPDCWNNQGAENWNFSNTGSGNHIGANGTITGATSSGGYFAWVDSSGTQANAILLSPFIDASSLTTPALSFYELSDNEGNANSQLDVEVWDGAAWNSVGTYNTNTVGWELKIIDLSSLTITGNIQVRFTFTEITTGDFYDDIAIDDVTVDELPSCIAPSSVASSNLTDTAVDFSWGTGGSETAWEYANVLSPSSEPASGTSTGTQSVSFSSLTPETTYDFYVRSDCGGEFSDWVKITYTTPATPPENDECSAAVPLTVNEDLNCTEVTNGTIAAATDSGVNTCGGTEDDDVWYSFVATNETHTVSLINVTGSTTDLYHAVYDADPGCGALGTALTCSDPNDSTTSGLTVGNTYYVQVYSWTSTGGQTSVFDICIGTPPAPPANDDCAAAEALTVNTDGTCTITTSGTLESSTESSIDPSCDTGTEWDVWYSFVAPSSGNVDFTVTLGTGNPLEYAVFDDCAGTTQLYCSDPLDGTSLTGLTPGTTYYLMVWNDGFETPGDFTICASEPTCTPSTATFTVVNDCDNSGGFLIDVEITDMGSATNLTVSNDQDATTFPATSTGTIVQFGPFTNGTNVVITVSDDSDANCFYNSTSLTQVACPPSNDDCAGATMLTQETEIADAASATPNPGTLEGATDSGLPAETCNGWTGTANDDVWYSFVALTSDVTITIDNTTVDIVIQAYSGTCGAFTNIGCADAGNPEEIALTGLNVGETYYFRVYQYGSGSTVGDNFDAKVWSTQALSTQDFDKEVAFTYYPNPVNNNLNLSSQKEINNVSVYNMVGQEVYRSTPNTMTDVVDMSGLQAGAYFVEVTVGNATKTVKVIKN